ncbi:phage tail tape measure protein [Bifidobacterium pseudocatenulatum]|uniref:phage tail tape measure protein n=2 Tax=Bifidobacterium pseudocatenulatum TaxID=28026 RepID=UPI00080BB2A0|nr:phage tail tape measure protein [Bifidobacterium pseudocatenulatum]MCB4876658.1 phage tail tape measure protein [Bifidobacterium pseudocatenulatum]MCB4900814.1 phage tail tape measure protein [Bifidobacterium pseudocatenulatum]
MAENKNIVIRLMADTASYEAAMTRAGSTAKTVASGMEHTGRKSALIASGMTAAGLAVAAFGVAAVKMAADFDQQMSTVQANTGATSAQMDQLRAAAIEAGASTVYSASDSADAINDLGKAGMSVTDILTGGLSGALNLAASDGMAVGDAAEYMANALSMFHLKGSQASQVADTLAAGAGKAVGNVSDFGEALNNCGAQANSFGMNIQETTGVLALFAQNGTIGAEAGTQLNSMLMKLAAPSAEAASTMKELGISAYDAQGHFVGMANFAGQLQKAEKNLTDEQRNQANATIFGSYAIKAANYLYEAGESGVNKWTKAVSESGYAAEQAAAKNNNLKGDLENLSGSMESLMISVGEGAQGPLRKMVQGLDTLVDVFAGLPSGAQQTIVVMASLAGVFGAVHKAAGNLNGSTSTMANNIGLAIDPIQRVKTALGSAQTAFDLFKGSSMSASEQMEAFGMSASKAQLKTAGFKAVGSSVMNLLGGPWGIALTVAGVALSAFISRQQKAKEAAEQLQSALESGSNISETIAGAYQDMSSGGVKLTTWLDKAGISLTDMTSAAMGNEAALKRVNKQIKEIDKPGIGGTAAAAIKKALKEESKAYDDASKKANEKSKAAKNAVDADGKSASAAKEAASANKDLADSASDASEGIDDLVQALFGLESGNLTADQAVDQLNQKIGELSDTCKDNGVVFDQSGNLLDRFSEQGTKTKQALEDIASSAQNAAEKILKQGESTGFSSGEIERANGVLQDARDAIIRQAEASGMSEQAANALADRWGLSSDSIKASIDNIKKTADNNKAKLDVDDSKAKSKTDNAKKNVDSVNKAKGTAKLDADDKASGKAKNAEKNVESASKSKGKATLDATDKASGKADKAKDNVRSVNNAKGTAKLDATDKASGKINAVNGMKLNNKNMVLTASDHASSKINAVNNKRLNNKKTTLNASDKASSKVDSVNRETIGDKHFTVRVTDHASATLRSIQNYQIADKSFTVTEKTKKVGGYTGGMFTDGAFQQFAGGGMFSGYVDPAWAPGNGLSDSVYLLNARLAAGEYTHNAAATAYYGVDTMRLLNERKIPREVFATANQMTGNQVSVQVDTASVVAAITSLHNDLGAIISAASDDSTVSDRDLGRLIRKYARA